MVSPVLWGISPLLGEDSAAWPGRSGPKCCMPGLDLGQGGDKASWQCQGCSGGGWFCLCQGLPEMGKPALPTLPGGCWMDAGGIPDGCWTLPPGSLGPTSACSLCRDPGADLGMLHPGAAPSKQGRNPPCHACCPAVMREDAPRPTRGYCTLPWRLGASWLTQGRSSFSICSDPAQQFLCCCLLPELRGSGGTMVTKQLGATMP